jgi:hypothetical protein
LDTAILRARFDTAADELLSVADRFEDGTATRDELDKAEAASKRAKDAFQRAEAGKACARR